ncbi:hypothetical protein Daura_06010 [Dactylosporangium aurantiacum]|uniref:Secreted protein n=1 Tax=Dactylosporangium aurantiacum TaxID=35754 RepID=A0A9Q9IMM5_9ACTN|nr:hypothetical protein [Dactylosporangium aurantiacum]MDG6108839.1 hypothetical protein [Dactylosporangium aurantiacum]UWZ55755.1 hypothetical protein Daura_06010 [Dactylosporangium aurantiacum]
MTRQRRGAVPQEHPRLAALRGTLDRQSFNARRVAALADNPGCRRRAAGDVSGADLEQLSNAAGVVPSYGQSPFAIDRGNRFENLLKRGSNYDKLFAVLHEALGLPLNDIRFEDLGDDGTLPVIAGEGPRDREYRRLRRRALRTRQALRTIVNDPAPTVLDHPVLTLSIGGSPVFLEPDALAAVLVGTQLTVVEIKSFANVDGVVPRDKAGPAARQIAVYVLALQQLLASIGHDITMVNLDALLITPMNTTTAEAVGNIVPVGHQVNLLRRQLNRVEDLNTLLEHYPADFTLDPQAVIDLLPPTASEEDRHEAVKANLRRIPANYLPTCRSNCMLGELCHRDVVDAGHPALLGPEARTTLAGIHDLRQAARIAAGTPHPADNDIDPTVALALRRARRTEQAAQAAAQRRRAAA